jgi:hypothetical protein
MAEAGRRDLPGVRAGRAWPGPGDRMVLGYPRGWWPSQAMSLNHTKEIRRNR